MNCSDIKQLLDIERPLTAEELTEFELHLFSCKSCSNLIDPLEDEDLWDIESGLPEVQPSESFTNQVMEQIMAIDRKARQRRQLWRRIGLSAASILLAFTVGAAYSPTFAAMLKSFFSYHQSSLDHAAELGYAESVEASVTDRGITISVHQLLADSPDLYVTYQVTKEGAVYEPFIRFDDKYNRLYVTDEAGKQYKATANGGSGAPLGSNDYSVLNVNMPYGLENKQLTLHMEIRKVGGEEENVPRADWGPIPMPEVTGNWKLSIPFSFNKSHDATVRIPLDQSYKTPRGWDIQVDKLVLSLRKHM